MSKWFTHVMDNMKLSKLKALILFSSISLFVKKVDLLLILLLSLSMYSIFLPFKVEDFLFLDQISSPLLSISILMISICLLPSWVNKKSQILLIFSLLVVELFFMTKSLMILFVTFELSLIPMFLLILGYGLNPERYLASKYMIMYTFLASAPLFIMIVMLSKKGYSILPFLPSSDELPWWSSMVLIFAFLVKIPMFGVHSWLPRAHVEAPLIGSMVLAGIMLKVGCYGLIRSLTIYPPNNWGLVWEFVYSISFFGGIFSALLAISSDDLKASVAYSSVSHMNMCIVSFLSIKSVGLSGGVITMVAHGMSSPLMFFNVTNAYSSSHSRSVIINKGVFSSVQSLKVCSLIVWAMNMSIPPFLPFVGELKMFSSVILNPFSPLLIFMIISLVSSFSIFLLSILIHSGKKLFVKEFPPMLSFIVSVWVLGVLMTVFFFTEFFPLSMGEYI